MRNSAAAIGSTFAAQNDDADIAAHLQAKIWSRSSPTMSGDDALSAEGRSSVTISTAPAFRP
jgi:hypothetical protein